MSVTNAGAVLSYILVFFCFCFCFISDFLFKFFFFLFFSSTVAVIKKIKKSMTFDGVVSRAVIQLCSAACVLHWCRGIWHVWFILS